MCSRIALVAASISISIASPGLTSRAAFAQPVELKPLVAEAFPLVDVKVTDGPFLHAQQLDVQYLLTLEIDRLLAWFRKEAGLEPHGEVYGGWERESLAGHTLGHYLSACSLGYAATGDARLKQRVDDIIAELALCQAAHGDGYVAAIPGGKAMFDAVRRGEIRSSGFDLNGAWAPWYTIHKLMAGLVLAHQHCANKQALPVLIALTDWVHATTAHLTEEQLALMLACEHGGMNESLADVYALTGEAKYLDLSQRVFHHHAVLDPLADGVDCLPGLHANTQIPKVIGLARLAEVTGRDQHWATAKFFWDEVIEHHTYVNGGNSSHEYFGPRDELSTRLGETTEACNTYNMLRLARMLFVKEPQAAYFDYYERALWNHILAHQHPVTGMLMYKGFLDPAARKGFCSPFDSFWCCVGSGMENHVKYSDSIYFHDVQGLWINLYVPSTVKWKGQGLLITQGTTLPWGDEATFAFTCERPIELAVRLRRPMWATERFEMSLNGERIDVSSNAGEYVTVQRQWHDGDRLQVRMPHRLRIEPTNDDPRVVAFMDGPILLCADLGDSHATPVLVAEHLLSDFVLDASQPLQYVALKGGRTVEVSAENLKQFGETESVTLVPHYNLVDRHYSVYLKQFTPAEWEIEFKSYRTQLADLAALQARTVDVLRIGEMQPERDHDLQSESSGVNDFRGKKFRVASDGGWFSFRLSVDPSAPMELSCTYWGDETGDRTFDVLIDEEKLATQTLQRNKPGEFFTVVYHVPPALIANKQSVVVRFQAHAGNMAGGLFDACRMLRAAHDAED